MGAIYTVHDSEGLYAALAKANGGDEIRLASGDYGQLKLDAKSGFDITFDAPVKITSMDANAPASFSGLLFDGVKNISLEGLEFDYDYTSGAQTWVSPFSILKSTNVDVKNSRFEGDVATGLSAVDDGYAVGRGLIVSNSSQIVVEDNEFTTWHKGLIVFGSQDVTVKGNDVHSIRSDGMNFVAVQSVFIEENHIHDFKGAPNSGDHMDMIQFWTSQTDVPSTDVIIRNNVLDIGDGDTTQSIFMRNEVVDLGQAGSEMHYQNILIEGNVIKNGHTHGITVGETDGLQILNNTVLAVDTQDDRHHGTPSILLKEASTSLAVQGNVVGAIAGYNENLSSGVKGNAYVQNTDPKGVGYYGDEFIESSLQGPAKDLVVAPGGMIDTLSAGAGDSNSAANTALFDVFGTGTSPLTLVFDATQSLGAEGKISESDAQFVWDFGDGNQMQGKVGSYTYAAAGTYDVTLTIVPNNGGETISTSAKIGIHGEKLLSFNSETGTFSTQSFGEESDLTGVSSGSKDSSGKHYIQLDGDQQTLQVSKEDISRLFNSEKFDLSMVLQADKPNQSWGEIARVHGSFIVNGNADGSVTASLWLDNDQSVSLKTSGVWINDGAEHKIVVAFDQKASRLEILVDGAVAASTSINERMPDMQHWGLTFGGSWGKKSFEGQLKDFDLNVVSSHFSDFAGNPPVLSALNDAAAPANGEGNSDNPEPVTQPGEGASGADDQPTDETSVTDPAADKGSETALSVLDDYILVTAELGSKELHGSVDVFNSDPKKNAVRFQDEGSLVYLGRLREFENTDALTFSVDFQKTNASDGGMRLVWNHAHIGLAVEEKGLKLYHWQDNSPSGGVVLIDDLGLDDTDLHNVRVIMDDTTDRLQVVLDGKVVYEENGLYDIEISEPGDGQWGWMLGSAWGHQFIGDIHDFRLEADADFVPVPQEDGSLII